MTETFVDVHVPYQRFLEYQDRRNRVAAEPTVHNLLPEADADVTQVLADLAVAQPLTRKP